MKKVAKPGQMYMDHPREYGENNNGLIGLFGVAGSSPRIRGECDGFTQDFRTAGIIPANTGRIQRPGYQGLCKTDHPREYGENRIVGAVGLLVWGSSPRIRGE